MGYNENEGLLLLEDFLIDRKYPICVQINKKYIEDFDRIVKKFNKIPLEHKAKYYDNDYKYAYFYIDIYNYISYMPYSSAENYNKSMNYNNVIEII